MIELAVPDRSADSPGNRLHLDRPEIDTEELSSLVDPPLAMASVHYLQVKHEAACDYETTLRVRDEFRLTGGDRKSLFLETRDGRWVMFVTVQGKRLDVALGQESATRRGYEPVCAVPFGPGEDVVVLFDNDSSCHLQFVSSPPSSSRTMVGASKVIPAILSASNCRVIRHLDLPTVE